MSASTPRPSNWFALRSPKVSLRAKLVLLIASVAGFVTVISLVASFFIQLKLFRSRLLEEYEITARMTASNLEAAVGFQDEHDASDILSTLSQREFIKSAAVYLTDGTLLAEFRHPDFGTEQPLPIASEPTRITRNDLVINQNIDLHGVTLGRIVLRAELGEQHAFILRQGWMSLLLLGAAIAVAILLAKQLGAYVARPIVQLAKTARRITQNHDFSTRQKRLSSDETGQLVDAFNEMMAEIESRSHALVLAKETAEASNRAKDDFLSVISHELRTPLNPIIGYVEILLQTDRDSKDRKQLALVKQYAEYLQNLIDHVIDYSRFERGSVNLSQEVVDCRLLCQNVLNLLHQQAYERGIDLSYKHEYEDGLSEIQTSVLTDRVKLQQVVLNLVSNALKFTEKGEIQVRSHLRAGGPQDAFLRIEVQDTGIGIDAKDKDRVFKPFSQIDVSLTRSHGGMGLGLAITKKIVEALGGKIDFCEAEPEGTIFWFELPVTLSEETDPESDAPSGREVPKQGKTCQILLVDDQLVNLELGESMLESNGHEVVCARSGAQAVELFQKGSFDLVILDIKMPKMDGYETARRLRSLETAERRTPIVAMTAHVTTRGNQQCIEAGMDDFMAKPFDTQRLAQITRKWLS